MEMKQQSAIEFMVTYSWAIILISLFIVMVILITGSRAPLSYVQSSCSIQPLLPCADSLLSYNAVSPMQYYIVFSNQLGQVLYFPSNSINATMSSLGSATSYSFGDCSPDFASEGSQVLCSVAISGKSKPKAGSQQMVYFVLNYKICTTDNAASCGQGLYRSSGYSIQSVSPTGVNFDYVTFITSPRGNIVLNGMSYFNGTSAYLPPGNYVIFAQPQEGMAFSSWSINSQGSNVLNAASQNTILSLASNAEITAEFS
ncbi:MAG: hypothetical protein KGI06_03445 [Candidatus Micrarchaeota archaeon]|nr:hypothetical protein [Candidatus Micrarchaeota archaeon]